MATDQNDFTNIAPPPSGEGPSSTGTAVLTDAAPSFVPVTIVRTSIIDGTPVPTTIFTSRLLATETTTSSTPGYSSAETSASSSTQPTAASATDNHSQSSGSKGIDPTIIVAIVVPVAVIALVSFGFFWWWMRRRTNKALKNTDTGIDLDEKRPHSRDESTHSHSSTRNLVSPKKGDVYSGKQTVLDIKEISRSSSDLSRSGASEPLGLGIGVAASPEGTPAHTRQNSAETSTPSGPPSKAPVSVRNFSRGPSRPGTANSEVHPSENQFPRDRNMNLSNRHEMRGRPSPIPEVASPRGPQQIMRSPGSALGPGPAPGPRGGPRSPPRTTGPGPRNDPARSRGPNDPPNEMRSQSSAPFKKPSTLPQTWSTSVASSAAKDPVSNVKSTQLALTSPTSPLALSFTEENMRIARLANSSRTDFYRDTNPHFSSITTGSPQIDQTVEPPTPSPRLPPPATRDAPPSKVAYPIPPPPPEPETKSPSHFLNDRRSMVSRMSSNDGYEDVEIDAKSDVSSLDEREKWEMEREQESRAESRTGQTGPYGAIGQHGGLRPIMQSPSLGSEHSGSQYSLPGKH